MQAPNFKSNNCFSLLNPPKSPSTSSDNTASRSAEDLICSTRQARRGCERSGNGFTLLEMMMVMAILAILAALTIPAYSAYIERAKVAHAIAEIRIIQNDIIGFNTSEDRLPIDLAEIGWGLTADPWGNPYQYTNFEKTPKGMWRKDKFLVPINSAFDLWSMGPDGKTAPPLTAKFSEDDIIRANDGLFIGRATLY